MLHILVAEDNALNRKLIVRLLSGLDCTVDAVETGRAVLAAVQARHYDLVLMDVRMPDLDGIEAAQQIAQILPPEERPIIYAVTAGVSAEEQRACLDAGMSGFLAKPVQLAEVRALLASLQE